MLSSPHLHRARLALRDGLDCAAALAAWLVLPLALLLFAQWPLRDLAGANSRQANDIAQWVFALYVAIALREATRNHAHLAAGLQPDAPRWRVNAGKLINVEATMSAATVAGLIGRGHEVEVI